VLPPSHASAQLVRKSSAAERAQLDLSCLQVVMCAAEPIKASTITNLAGAFEPAGLKRAAFCPA
jgi:hypothetical protein